MDRPVPDKFPPGCEFYVTERSPFVFIPGEGAFCGWGGTLSFAGALMPWEVRNDSPLVSEEEFHRAVAASQAKS